MKNLVIYQLTLADVEVGLQTFDLVGGGIESNKGVDDVSALVHRNGVHTTSVWRRAVPGCFKSALRIMFTCISKSLYLAYTRPGVFTPDILGSPRVSCSLAAGAGQLQVRFSACISYVQRVRICLPHRRPLL